MAEKPRGRKRNSQQTKDRVLQARIPEQLDAELRSHAEQLGLSVSTIVRNVLLNTFDLVEGVVSDSSQIARALTGWSASPSHSEEEPAVLGWQEAILNRNGVCDECNTILPIGQRAAIGVPAGSRAIFLCLECLPAPPTAAADVATVNPADSRAKSKRKTRTKKRSE